MEKTKLFSMISNLTLCEICFTQNTDVQYNLFEQAQPENLAFNSYHSLSDYNNFLMVQYAAFKKEADKHIDSGKDIYPHLLAMRVWNNKYYDEHINDKKILLHDLIFLEAEHQHTYPIEDIKLKVSGFLSAQKKMLEEVNNYLLFKQNQSEGAIRFSWLGSPTDLMEMITSLWKLGIIRTLAGNPVSKKMLVKGFEFMFDINLKNFEVLQSKAITRKDSSPFLTKLKQCFDNFVDSKLS